MMGPGKLDGIMITEHDHLWPAEDIADLNAGLSYGRIYTGVEVSSRNGHFLVIGLVSMDGIASGIDIDTLIAEAEAQNAAVIWAHPRMLYSNMTDPQNAGTLPKGLHGLEVASSVISKEDADETLSIAKRLGLADVGGSDAHILQHVGCAYTIFETLPENERNLADFIRQGHCTAGQRPAPLVMETVV